MTFGYRRIFAALWILSAPLFIKSSHSEELRSQPPPDVSANVAEKQMPPEHPTAERKVDTATAVDWSKIECTKPSSHDEADLCEQRRMSRAAENSLQLNAWQLGLGVIGALAILWTLHFTRVAANAARKAANAATDQVELSRKTIIATERAFVFVSKMHAMAGYSMSKQKVIDWTFYLVWENSGNTPTHKMKMGTNWHSFDKQIPDDFDFQDVGGRAYEVPMMLGPRATTFSGECVVPIEILEDVQAEKKHLYIWGWVEYNDVFDGTQRHRTESCTHVIVAGNPSIHQHGPNNEPMVPFQYNGHKFFNGADDECFRQPVS